eukprot:scaffold446501_cov42-Prasinocladus_malaysianus.AAC.1
MYTGASRPPAVCPFCHAPVSLSPEAITNEATERACRPLALKSSALLAADIPAVAPGDMIVRPEWAVGRPLGVAAF